MRQSHVLASLIAASLVLTTFLWADPQTSSVITVPNIHCDGCANRIAARVYKVANVKAVAANVHMKQIIVEPRENAVVSPRALWEAVEGAGFRVTRLAGPSGTFVSKPRS